MTHTTTSRTTLCRTSSTLGAAALLGLVLAGPALARPDPDDVGSLASVPAMGATHSRPKGHIAATYDSTANAVESRMQQALMPVAPPSFNSWPHGSGSPADTRAGIGQVTAPRLDETSIQYLQIGLGVVGGAALTAAAAGAVASRNRRHALSV